MSLGKWNLVTDVGPHEMFVKLETYHTKHEFVVGAHIFPSRRTIIHFDRKLSTDLE